MAEGGIGKSGDMSTENQCPKDLASGSTEAVNLMCQPCEDEGENTEAEGFCQVCKEHLCRVCIKIHKRTSVLKRHEIVEIERGTEGDAKLKEVNKVVFEKCPLHAGQYYKFYCPHHDVFGCGDCTVMDHRTCRMEYIPDVARDFKRGDVYKQQQEIIEKLNNNIDKCIGNVDGKTGEIEEEAEVTSMSVREYSSEIREAIKIREKELLVTTDNLKEENLGPVSKMKKECLSVKSEVATVNEMLKSAESDEMNLFMTSCRMKKRLTGIEADVKRVENEFKKIYVKNNDFQKNDTTGQLMNAVDHNALGHVGSSTGLSMERGLHKCLFIPGDDINIRHNDGDKSNLITGMVKLSKERLLVVDRSSSSCKLVDTTSKKVVSALRLDKDPWDATVLPDDRAAVTVPSANRVYFLSAKNDTLQLLGKVRTESSCYGIASLGHKLVFSLTNPWRIQVGDVRNGNSSVIQPSCNKELFKMPYHIRTTNVNGIDEILVSDIDGCPHWEHGLVKRMTLNGKVTGKFLGLEFAGSEAGMDVTSGGQVVICNKDKNTIHVISPDLNESHIILYETVKSPQAVCYCPEESKLYVSSSRTSYKIKVYNI